MLFQSSNAKSAALGIMGAYSILDLLVTSRYLRILLYSGASSVLQAYIQIITVLHCALPVLLGTILQMDPIVVIVCLELIPHILDFLCVFRVPQALRRYIHLHRA